MNVNGVTPGIASSATRYQARQLNASLEAQREPYNYHYRQTPPITELEARAIINKELLEALGVKFAKTELEGGYKRIDRIRNGQIVAFMILDPQSKKIEAVEQLSENHVGSITFYREDGETPFVKYNDITPNIREGKYKVETATLYTEEGRPIKTKQNFYMDSVPEYDEFDPEAIREEFIPTSNT